MNDELNDKIDRDVPAGDGGHPSRAGEPAGHPGDREAGGTVSEESVRAGEQNKQDVEKLTVEEEASVAEEMTDKEIRSASEGKFGRLKRPGARTSPACTRNGSSIMLRM